MAYFQDHAPALQAYAEGTYTSAALQLALMILETKTPPNSTEQTPCGCDKE